VVRAVNEKSRSVYSLWDDEVGGYKRSLGAMVLKPWVGWGGVGWGGVDITAVGAACPLNNGPVPAAPGCNIHLLTMQDVIMKPDKFDEALPASGSVTSLSGALMVSSGCCVERWGRP